MSTDTKTTTVPGAPAAKSASAPVATTVAAPVAAATAVAAAPAKPKQTIRQILESEGCKNELARVLPKHLTADRMARVAITALTRTPDLAKCTQESFFRCLMDLSQAGLEPDGRRAHLIPYWSNKLGAFECQLIIDYKGLVELAMRTGDVASIHADIVCDNDQFKVDLGEVVKHEIDYRKPRGAAYAVWSRVTFKGGGQKCEVMTLSDVNLIRSRSKASNSGPWVTDYNEMAKKTVFKRLSKWITLASEIHDALEQDFDGLPALAPPANTPRISSLDALTDVFEPKEAIVEPQPGTVA
jgi:recombination protein RecT